MQPHRVSQHENSEKHKRNALYRTSTAFRPLYHPAPPSRQRRLRYQGIGSHPCDSYDQSMPVDYCDDESDPVPLEDLWEPDTPPNTLDLYQEYLDDVDKIVDDGTENQPLNGIAVQEEIGLDDDNDNGDDLSDTVSESSTSAPGGGPSDNELSEESPSILVNDLPTPAQRPILNPATECSRSQIDPASSSAQIFHDLESINAYHGTKQVTFRYFFFPNSPQVHTGYKGMRCPPIRHGIRGRLKRYIFC